MSETLFYEKSNGQLSFFPIRSNKRLYVVQSNNLIRAKQNLSLNEAKLIRIIIAQIVSNDVEFKPYIISPQELAEMLDNKDSVNIYHSAKAMCTSIMKKQLEIQSDDGSWAAYQWVTVCKYDAKTKKIQIKLNEELKPFLINLINTGYYAQYQLENALKFNSIFAIRIFELIMEELKFIPAKNSTDIIISKETIRNACYLDYYDYCRKITVTKFEKISQFKEKVLDVACKEIERCTLYTVSYSDIKEGKSITAFTFHVKYF